MPIFAEKETKIFGDILFDVVNETNITRVSPGAKFRALAQATSKKLGRMWSQFEVNFLQAYLEGAEGQYLDFLGAMLNTPRLGQTTAQVTAAEQVVRFYVTSAVNFGGINGGTSITIPAGTTVSTKEGGTGLVYRMPFTTVLPSTDDEAFVTLEATTTGSRSNVGSGQLVYHSFTNYTDSANESLLVTNDSEIISGQEVESDTNYRFRIANAVLSSEKANQTAIRLAGLSIPGVADLILLPYYSGIGTFDIIVSATSPTTPQSLVDTVRDAVLKVKAEGIVPYVRAPYETGISMDVTMELRNRTSATEEQGIIDSVKGNLANYINNLDIGEEFIINETIERILATSQEIKDIGQPNEPIDEVRVSIESRVDSNRVTSVLLDNYTPEPDEKLYAENLNVVIA